ncbi:MAG: type II secretion system F family protein [Bacillota bacterium]
MSGVLLFLLTALLAYLVLSVSSGTQKQETPTERLQRLVAQRKALEGFATRDLPGTPLPPEGDKLQRLSVREAARQALVGVVERATSGSSVSNRLESQLQRADWKWKPAEFLIAQAVAAGAGLLLSLILLPSLWWLLPVLGWITPTLLLKRSIASRQKLFTNQLPDALAIVSNALRSGYSFLQAMDVVSREMPAPVSKEFSIVLKEARVNIPVEEALAHMVQRVQSPDLDLVVTAVLIQRQVGGNLAEVLDKIGGTVKDRIRLQGEIRSMTAQGRMSGWVISLLPLVLALIISMISPGMLDPLFKHPVGMVMLGMGVVMQSVGILMIRKMVNMEV